LSELSETSVGRISEFFAGEPASGMSDPVSSRLLLRPYSCFVDESGDLFIADTGAFRVTVVNMKEGISRNIVRAGDQDFVSPVGIVSVQGRIYVSDSSLRKVFILDMHGKLAGMLEGDFERPTSLALDRTRGLLYVADTLAHVIYRYSLDGRRLGSVGRPGSEEGEFNFPTHLWVDGKGRLYVTDAMNFRVQIFSPDGAFEMTFGMLGDSYGDLEKPKGIAGDSEGNIYVVDSIKDVVKIFGPDGRLLLFFGQQGENYGEFWLPSGIAIDGNDIIYVADTYNRRIQAFRYLGGRGK
jgi:sugar lactone lactonase YvrE